MGVSAPKLAFLDEHFQKRTKFSNCPKFRDGSCPLHCPPFHNATCSLHTVQLLLLSQLKYNTVAQKHLQFTAENNNTIKSVS